MKKNILWAVLFATSCSSYYNNGDERYLDSKNGPEILISPPLNAYNISHFYDLPAQNTVARVDNHPPI